MFRVFGERETKRHTPTSIKIPPIKVAYGMLSEKILQANIEAIIGSPIGTEATIVGEVNLIEKYNKLCPKIVGTTPRAISHLA